MRRLRADRGSAALFVAIFAPAMIFMAGLVIDGGGGLEARQRAADIAEQAARAGAAQCDVALLRSAGTCWITDEAAVRAAAQPYTQGNGVTSWSTQLLPDPDNPGRFNGVRVTVNMEFQTTLLGIVPKFKTIPVSQTADAIAVTGL